MAEHDSKSGPDYMTEMEVRSALMGEQCEKLVKDDSPIRRFYVVDLSDIGDMDKHIMREKTSMTRRGLFPFLASTAIAATALISEKEEEKLLATPALLAGGYFRRSSLAYELVKMGVKNNLVNYVVENELPIAVKLRNLGISIQTELITRHENNERQKRGETGIEPISLAIGKAHGGITEIFKYPLEERIVMFASFLEFLQKEGLFSEEEADIISVEMYKVLCYDRDTDKASLLDLNQFI